MAMIVLTLHLIVCICLIGLVLLQRSEGGALGMGGGGGGSLMSGRGAADALAKMTSVAGGFFLVTSLTLTMISGTAQSSESGSVFDALPAPISRPAVQPPAPQTTPDPLEGNALQIAPETQQAAAEMPARASSISLAPAAAAASTRAGPVVEGRPAATAGPLPAANTQRASVQQTAAGGAVQQPRTTVNVQPPAAVIRPPVGALVTTNPRPAAAGTTQPASANTTATGARPPALIIPNTSGAGGSLQVDGPVSQLTPESSQAEPVETVRRERAGPDQ